MQDRFDIALGRLSSELGRRPSILLAVSGGVDSMTMAHLAMSSTVPERICVAHMNFSLRGDESDGDEAFVRQWCKERGIELFCKKVDTQAYAGMKGISIEMAARELRYSWFESLLAENHLDFVAVAHNLNDCAETMYLNILRGTGLKGICGIRPVNGRIIRPLLEFPRSEISRYALKNAIKFRMDSTNLESEYSRNRIRNEVFPQFEQINPSFLQSVAASMEHFAAAQEYIEAHLSEEEDEYLSVEDGVAKLNIVALKADRFRSYRMFDILVRYGFNAAQVKQIEESLDSCSGKRFSSPTHLLVRDRNTLNIYPVEENPDFTIQVEIMDKPADFDPKSAPEGVLYVDADKLNLPLKCRGWHRADRFRPFGMQNYRKLSDFFSDLKLDVEQKRRQRIVTHIDADGNEQIVCIAGLRIDDRFKVTSLTRRIAVLK